MGIIYPGGGGGGTSSGLPQPIPSDVRYTVHANGSGGAVWRQTTNADLGLSFTPTIVLSGSVDGAPSGTLSSTYERGTLIESVTAACTYANGTATSASIATAFTGSTNGSDYTLGAWSISSPFASGSATGNVRRMSATTSDPVMTVTLTASSSTATGRTGTDAVTWTFRVYDGLVASSTTTVTEADIEALTTNGLLSSRTLTTTRSPSSQKWLRCFPDLAQYTTGTITFLDENGATFEFDAYQTVSVTNAHGITVNYRAYLSSFVLTATNRSCVGT